LALQQLVPKEIVSKGSQINQVTDEISVCIDNLHTIVSCSLHQKRIIDDVLTLSKLDSNLLLISPVRVEPTLVVSEAIRMFDVECSQMHINLEFKQDDSLRGFEWVMMDPSRMLQVLINLLTNAIKFTKDRDIRNITVTLGGAWTQESLEKHNVTFAGDNQPQNDIYNQTEWGSGEKGYIWLRVDDTGCGMTSYEQSKLFSRFTQATPRTHIKYGGSGLGLFISKSLTALQGGSIGVKSTANVGSSFVFYISTRIAEPPKDATTGGAMRPIIQRTISGEAAVKAAKLNILMVEDNLVNQKVLSKQLQKAGCNVSVAGNGVEALEWLKSSVYWNGVPVQAENNVEILVPKREVDIVLMDIEMPVMDGLACAREIRAWESCGLLAPPPWQPPSRRSSPPDVATLGPSFQELTVSEQLEHQWTKRLPILAVSANARSEQINEALAAGMVSSCRLSN
jgi:CheY-like chemotaxis protein